MLTSFGSLMVSRLIEFLFRKLKAFHYFTVVEVQHAFGRTTNYAIIQYKSEHVVICGWIFNYSHARVCVCVHAWATVCPLVRLHLSTGISHSERCSRCSCCYCAASTLPSALPKYYSTNTHRRRGWPVSDAVQNSRTAPPVLELIKSVAAQCAAIWSAHNMQINSNNKHNSAGRTD